VNKDKTILAQVLIILPMPAFRNCVARHGGEHNVRTFTSLDQFLCLAFAQLTHRESLRDIEISLRAMRPELYHMGIRGRISRSALADANETRDRRIFGASSRSLPPAGRHPPP